MGFEFGVLFGGSAVWGVIDDFFLSVSYLLCVYHARDSLLS